MDKALSFLRELQAIAQSGLAYTQDVYDKERFEKILSMIADKLANPSQVSQAEVEKWLFEQVGYATPKLVVRALILENNQLLLVKESQNHLWALPGGWADVNLSPRECAVKEVFEETGLTVKISHLLAFWDKLKHTHPPHWPHTYIAFFYAQVVSGQISLTQDTAGEIEEVQFFPVDALPPLCQHRNTDEQIQLLIKKIQNDCDKPALFD